MAGITATLPLSSIYSANIKRQIKNNESCFIKTRQVKKQKAFQLKNIGHKRGELREFGRQLISNLGDDIFIFKTRQVLLFNILKQISPVNKSLKLDDTSIERACEKVIRNFGLHREAKISVLTDNGFKEITSKKKTNTEKFCQIIIEMDKVPAHAYELLLSQVNRDLKSISELIKWYETKPCIQRHNKDNEIPKSHEDRIIFDFYKRCVAERIEILNFQLYGVKDRAIAKSKYTPKWLSSIWAFSEMFNDRPYHFAQPFSIHYFDSRRIDLSGHRIVDLYIDEAREMQKLYSDNPYKFYRLYFKRIPVQQHFQNFKFYLPYLPLIKDRNLIFDELIKLFKAKRWISFYALALPQVEGLFSEMCSVVSPEKDLSQKSLTHKVNSLRPFHYMSTSYFDYYQYHIPLQRNRFSHTGYDEDFKLKSYDLLVDLSHLLKVFYELDNPLVKVKKLHTRRNFEDFISLKEFADYFKLLDDIKPQQKKDVKTDIEIFEKEFLSQDCSLDYTCYEMMQELPKQLKEFVDNINESFRTHHSAIEFEKLKISDIDNLLKDENQFEVLTNCFIYKNDIFERLDNYSTFLQKYSKYLPTLRPEVKDELGKLHTEFGMVLKSITYTDNQIKKLNEAGREKNTN